MQMRPLVINVKNDNGATVKLYSASKNTCIVCIVVEYIILKFEVLYVGFEVRQNCNIIFLVASWWLRLYQGPFEIYIFFFYYVCAYIRMYVYFTLRTI